MGLVWSFWDLNESFKSASSDVIIDAADQHILITWIFGLSWPGLLINDSEILTHMWCGFRLIFYALDWQCVLNQRLGSFALTIGLIQASVFYYT